MTREYIVNEICAIMRDRLRVDETLLVPENEYAPLTASPFDLEAQDLVYLFVFIREAFQIEIPGAALADEGFNSVAAIADIVERGVL